MPKRVVDGDALWRSDKLNHIEPPSYRAEYANLIPLALANGTFEADPRHVWASVYAYNRPDVTLETAESILAEFVRVKMLFIWRDASTGKQWGFWVGIDRPGRLPGKSRHGKNERVGLPPPEDELRKFLDPNRFPTEKSGFQEPPRGSEKLLGSGFGSGFGSGINITSESSDSDMPSHAAKREKAAKPGPSQAGKRLAGLLKERILQNNSSARITDKQVEIWAREADRMILRDGRTEEQIATTIEWAQGDSFWLANILSMAKLRERFDQLTLQRKNRNPGGKDDSVTPSLERPLSERLAETRAGLDGN